MIYLCLGRREQGKTTLAYFLIRKQPARVIFDPRGLFPAPAGVATTGAEFGDAMDTLFEKRAGEVVIVPGGKTQPMFESVTGEVREWLQSSPAPIALLVDELRFVDTDTESFDWILRCAGREHVSVVLTAHRPADVATDIRAIADMWCIFQTTQEHDLKVISERCSPDVAAEVSKLKPREFIAWDDTKGTWSAHRHPDRWYVPLGRHPSSAVAPRPLNDLDGEAGKGVAKLF